MKFLNGGNIVRLRVDEISVGARLRAVRDVQVQNLILMAEYTGITTPIHVRKVGKRYELIDGAHRLEAARRMGLEEIACLVVECRQDEAKSYEASNNLGAARMTPLQTAVFVASWKKTYYELHPERRPGVFKGNQHRKDVVTPENGLTNSIADALGRKPSQIFKIIAVGERLTAEEIAALDSAERSTSLEDLEAIGKITDPGERVEVVRRLATGKARKVAQARRQIADERGENAPAKDPVEEAFTTLSKAWARTSKEAKRRFVAAHFEELGLLGAEEEEARFEAEKPELLAEIARNGGPK